MTFTIFFYISLEIQITNNKKNNKIPLTNEYNQDNKKITTTTTTTFP